MMKTVVVLFVSSLSLVSLVLAAPEQNPKNAVIRRFDNDVGLDGYNYAVETSDGQSKQEQGKLINIGSENEAMSVRGQFSYTGPDGVIYTVTYVADENGFRAEGAHLPVAP